jgi:predicted CXXCH cytochrome family protein
MLLLALAVAAGAAAWAEGPFKLKPGARGKACMSCHEDMQETIAKPHVHTPVAAGSCTDCHDPHTSIHGKLLASDPSQICTDCHDGMLPDGAASAHRMVVDGNCVACHDPHASDNPGVVTFAGSELCFGCHYEIEQTVNGAKFGHGPVEDDCLICHDPHASAENDFMLNTPEPDLCVTCHDPSQRIFAEQHGNYPVGEGKCTSCHSPHGSDQAGLLAARVHAPVARGMCKQCHQDADSEDALALKREGPELCRACHNDTVNRTLTAPRLHWAVAGEDSCLGCHEPHASDEPGLLAAPTKALCESCHAPTIAQQTASKTKHPPIDDGECSSCHDPHASEHVFLLHESDLNELCGTCHDWMQHSSHPIGSEAIDLRNPNLALDCASCHATHGTEHDNFTHLDGKRDLCVECHQDRRR